MGARAAGDTAWSAGAVRKCGSLAAMRGLDLTMWDAVTGTLTEQYRVVRYDLLGHGRSARPQGPYSLGLFIDQLHDLFATLGLRRAHVVGFSMGGLIAQGFAIAYPELIASLILANTVAARSDEQRRAVLERVALVEQNGILSTLDVALERWFTPEYARTHPRVAQAICDVLAANDPTAYVAAYRLFATADADLAGRLDQIVCPTLVITGELDGGSTPRMAEIMRARIPGARRIIVPGVRHMLPVEGAPVFAEAVVRFLAAHPLPQEGV